MFTIFLSLKLIIVANIRDYILEERRLTESIEREDARCVKFIIVELIETETILINTKTIDLRYLERWKKSIYIKRFLADTYTISLKELYKVSSPGIDLSV